MASLMSQQKETVGFRVRAFREKVKVTAEDLAGKVGISVADLERLEAGGTEVEHWAPILGAVAVNTGKPTSRFMAESGKGKDAVAGQCGPRVKKIREELGLSLEKVLEGIPIERDEYTRIEEGKSVLEGIPIERDEYTRIEEGKS
eukprot:Hpha_TRINITY_DN15871_c1_g11::TRINITY_DN15871_c1_g11_i1::g.187791::m.187791